jgi:hypothetical protein
MAAPSASPAGRPGLSRTATYHPGERTRMQGVVTSPSSARATSDPGASAPPPSGTATVCPSAGAVANGPARRTCTGTGPTPTNHVVRSVSVWQPPVGISGDPMVVVIRGGCGTCVVSVAAPKVDRQGSTRDRPAATGVSSGEMVSTQA